MELQPELILVTLFLGIPVLRCRKRGELFDRCFRLVALFPRIVGFAIDVLTSGLPVECNATGSCRLAIPVSQAVATEAPGDHQVDVLYVGTFPQVADETAKHGGFEFSVQIGHGEVFEVRDGSQPRLGIAARSWDNARLPPESQ